MSQTLRYLSATAVAAASLSVPIVAAADEPSRTTTQRSSLSQALRPDATAHLQIAPSRARFVDPFVRGTQSGLRAGGRPGITQTGTASWRQRHPVLVGAIVGAGVGAAFGGVWVAGEDAGPGTSVLIFALSPPVIGAGVGALVGMALN